jgi:hypothetical protein
MTTGNKQTDKFLNKKFRCIREHKILNLYVLELIDHLHLLLQCTQM